MQGTSLGVLGDPLITLEVLNFGNEIQVHKGFRLNFKLFWLVIFKWYQLVASFLHPLCTI